MTDRFHTRRRIPLTRPLDNDQEDRGAWLFLALVAGVMLIEIGLPLVERWLGWR